MSGRDTSGHTIRLLTAREISRQAAVGWTSCTRQKCTRAHVYFATYLTAYGKHERHRLCVHHGELFATRHKLDLPQRPVEAPCEPIVVTSRGGRKYMLCPACLHMLDRSGVAIGACIDSCRCTSACHKIEVAA